MNETIQYIIVALIIMASAIWIVVRYRKKKQGKDSVCCGCSLEDACQNKRKNQSCCDKPDSRRSHKITVYSREKESYKQ